MTLISMHYATTKCGVFTFGLQNSTKTWAFSPINTLGGSRAQQPIGQLVCAHPNHFSMHCKFLLQRSPGFC